MNLYETLFSHHTKVKINEPFIPFIEPETLARPVETPLVFKRFKYLKSTEIQFTAETKSLFRRLYKSP